MRAISSPIFASIPNSSSSSRRKASRGCSPSSILPPGNSHFSGIVWCRVRWHTRSLPFCSITAATTRFITCPDTHSRTSICLQLAACGSGAVLHEHLVFGPEGGGKMAVDVELARDFSLYEDRHHYFRFCFQRTRQVPWVFADVVHDDGPATGCGRAAYALIQWDARVWSHRPHECFQKQHRRLSSRFEHIEADPVILQHPLMQQRADALHKIFRGRR